MVLLPEPDRPVNHSVAPRCLSRPSRSTRVTWPSCQVMFVALMVLWSLPCADTPCASLKEQNDRGPRSDLSTLYAGRPCRQVTGLAAGEACVSALLRERHWRPRGNRG